MVTIDFIVKRHGEKEKLPVDALDIEVPLSVRSREKEFVWGEKHIPRPPHYAHIILIHSDYLRARETINQNMLGAGYGHYDGEKVTTIIRSDIGLGQSNFDHPDIPPYGHEPEVLNAYVRTLFEKFWHARPGNPPCLAAYAAAILDAIAYGIERAQGLPLPDDARVLVEIVTHCPVIDAGARALESVLHLASEREAMVMLSYPGWKTPANHILLTYGAFQTGESFSGQYVPDWKTEGPYPHAGLHRPIKYDNLTFLIKGEKFVFHWENDACPPVDRPSVLRSLRSARQHYLEEASTLRE